MTMFGVPEGTQVKMVRKDREWNDPKAFVEYTTKSFQVFDVADVTIDPTGIAHLALGPNDRYLVGGQYAYAGWYGFAIDDPRRPAGDMNTPYSTVLVPMNAVEVN